MSDAVIGAALAGVAVLQALATEAMGKRWNPLSDAYFQKQVDDDTDNELGLSSSPDQKAYAIEVLHGIATLGATAISTLAALCASVIGCLATLIIAVINDASAIVVIMAFTSAYIAWFAVEFAMHIAKGDLGTDLREKDPGIRPKNKIEEPRWKSRRYHNSKYHLSKYALAVRAPYLLTRYKTVLFAASLTCIIASPFL
ncbi:hypothetical protein [Streptomyces sp. JHA19]|uniref:hypothetical protein n=1 Tax=Streptomyces sp. JHA19 TaxID=1577588 RepID=UPI00131C2F61|nr:hypothetical protein [Streptomyces sp. JHA19]